MESNNKQAGMPSPMTKLTEHQGKYSEEIVQCSNCEYSHPKSSRIIEKHDGIEYNFCPHCKDESFYKHPANNK